MTAKTNTNVSSTLICGRCMKAKEPHKWFKVYSTDAGLEEMRRHVKNCK